MILVVHNEERFIRKKLENLLAVTWPSASRELLVVSDCSTDGTDEIVGDFANRGVRLVVAKERIGKDRCQLLGVQETRANVIVFTDASTSLDQDSLTAISSRFGDRDIACVSGVDVPTSDAGRVEGESLYVRYEMYIRRIESMLGGMVGASGCFFAVRRTLCARWREDLSSDFALPLEARLAGLAVVAEERAVCRYLVLADPGAEFERKVRTIVHGMQVLRAFATSIARKRAVFLAFQLWSHKLLRWSSPFLLGGAMLAGLILMKQSSFWLFVSALLAVGSLLAISAYLFPAFRERSLPRSCLYFALVNLSMLAAWVQLARGIDQHIWQPSRR